MEDDSLAARDVKDGWSRASWATRVQPSHRLRQDGRPPHQEVWLLSEWPESEKEPTKYLSLRSVPPTYTLATVSTARQSVAGKSSKIIINSKEELGLDHYEGRNWHRLAPPHRRWSCWRTHSSLWKRYEQKKLLGGPCRGRDVKFNIILFTWTGVCAYCGAEGKNISQSITLNVVILGPDGAGTTFP